MTAKKKNPSHITEVTLPPRKLTWTGNRYVAGGLLVVAVSLLVASTQISWDVWDEKRWNIVRKGSNLPVGKIQQVPEYKLVQDATFSGVEYIDGNLYSIYDRTKKLGKVACPT